MRGRLAAGSLGVVVGVVVAMVILGRDWPGWKWPGWVGIAALGQDLAAFATLVTVIFFWRQLRLMASEREQNAEQWSEEQARDEVRRGLEYHERREREATAYRRSLTPFLTLESIDTGAGPGTGVMRTKVRVHADGHGPAYNVIVKLHIAVEGEESRHMTTQVKPYVRAPESADVNLDWIRFEEPSRVELDVVYFDVFGEQHTLKHTGTLSPSGLEITDWPQLR